MTIGSKEAHKSGTENVAAIGYAPVTICGRCWLTLHDPYPPHRSRYAGIFHFAFQMTRNSSPAETRRSLGSRLSPSCRYHAADSKRGSRTTQNWPFCVATARRTNHKWKAPNRRSGTGTLLLTPCNQSLSGAARTLPPNGRGVDCQAAVSTAFRTGISARLGWCRRPIADVPADAIKSCLPAAATDRSGDIS